MRPRPAAVPRRLVIAALAAATTAGCAAGPGTPAPSRPVPPASTAEPAATPRAPVPSPPAEPGSSGITSSPSAAPEIGDLEGPRWLAVEISGHATIPGAEPTLTFAGGTIEGSDGCNVYTGPVSVAAGTYQPGPLNGSLMACPDALAGQAEAFIAVMQAPGRIGLQWDRGRLVIGSPEAWAEFVPTARPAAPPGGGG